MLDSARSCLLSTTSTLEASRGGAAPRDINARPSREREDITEITLPIVFPFAGPGISVRRSFQFQEIKICTVIKRAFLYVLFIVVII